MSETTQENMESGDFLIETAVDTISTSLTADDIHEMIVKLGTTENGEPLKKAMFQLKQALKANPDACALMLDEDVGLAVQALRKLTGQTISQEAAKKGKGAVKKFDFSDPAIQKEIEDNLFD